MSHAMSGVGGGRSVRDGRIDGAAIVYRMYDVGFEIDLMRAAELLASQAPVRKRPLGGEAQAIQIANPPLTVALGPVHVPVPDVGGEADVSARIFDFGVVSIRVAIPAAPGLTWGAYTRFGNAVDVDADLTPIFTTHRDDLCARLRPAVTRPNVANVTEDYIVFRVNRVAVPGGGAPGVSDAELWSDEDLVPLLLNERRALSRTALRQLLPQRFSYYGDDLTILTWDNALVVEPSPGDTDVQYILEFANAQLLELRVYDALLEAELPAMYRRVENARRRRLALLPRRYAKLLADLVALVADFTEVIERVESALKVTDDVYLAHIYTAALDIFRQREWRAGIERKLAIIRETYVMLNAESQAVRSETMEILIIVLITAELVLAVFLR